MRANPAFAVFTRFLRPLARPIKRFNRDAVSRINEGDLMTEKKPPEWGNDPLSVFFKDAEYNDRVTALNFPAIYDLLGRVHALFKRFEEAIEKDNREEFLVPRFLMVRSHSSFLAGIRLAMSGQVSEALPVLRSGVECTWYALHIAKDPKGTERAEIWLRRNEDDAAKSRCKSEFTVAKVRQTHETLDANTAKDLHGIYENLIDFGAHPNQFGVMTAMRKSEADKQVDFSIGILHAEPLTIVFALRMAVGVAVGALKTFQLVFPERFMLAGIDLEIEKLISEANALFKSYAPKGNKASPTG